MAEKPTYDELEQGDFCNIGRWKRKNDF